MKTDSALPRGVLRAGNRYHVKIKIDGKSRHFGTFATVEEATAKADEVFAELDRLPMGEAAPCVECGTDGGTLGRGGAPERIHGMCRQCYDRRRKSHHDAQRADSRASVRLPPFGPMPAYLAYWPTQAEPGTLTKQKVLSARAERGLPLHHPGDRGHKPLLERLLSLRIA